MSSEARQRKLAERIKEIVARSLEFRVKDARLGFVTITDVRITPDLRDASVFYTVYGDERERADSAAALESAKGMLRTQVGQQTGVKFTPTLTFIPDAIPDTARHVEELLLKAAQADAATNAPEFSGEKPVVHADHIGAVVHGDLRRVIDGGGEVLVVGLLILALDGVGGDAVVLHQRGGHVVLRGQRVGCHQHHVGATGLERAGQVGGLRGHVEAGRDAEALEGLLLLEPLADLGEHGHVAIGPLDALATEVGQAEVGHVMLDGCRHRRVSLFASKPPQATSVPPCR